MTGEVSMWSVDADVECRSNPERSDYQGAE
jgi:hypothetical protein